MNNDLTNLLPIERQRRLSRDYILRAGVVVAIFLAGLTLVAAVLLIPTFVLLEQSEDAKKMQLANIESSLSSANEAEFSSRLSALSDNVAILMNLSKAPSVNAIIREILAIPHPGITISGFTYSPASSTNKDSAKTLAISGSSATRDALRSYQLVLQKAPLVLSASLPVSAYAKDSDIAFTITVALSP